LFLNQALPATTDSRAIETEAVRKRVSFSSSSLPPVREHIFESAPSTSQQLETPVKQVQGDDDDESDDDDDVYIEPEVQQFGREQFGEIASSYLAPYVHNKKFLDKQYGLRKERGNFKIGDSLVTVDVDIDIHIKGHGFKGTEGLWELLTRKKVDTNKITKQDLKAYKAILEMTHGHLERYEPASDTQISRGPKFRDVISKLFFPSERKRRGVESALRRAWIKY
jgi:hypothetical protein